MADIIAVLKSAIEGLNDNSPAIREKVYQRARLALSKRLILVGPPPEAVIERHKFLLEAAIEKVEGMFGGETDQPPADPPNIFDYGKPDQFTPASAVDESRDVADHAPTDERPAKVPVASEESRAASFNVVLASPWSVANRPFDCQRFFTGPSVEPQQIEASKLAATFTGSLGWPLSSHCGICLKWATCVDVTQCWNRLGPS